MEEQKKIENLEITRGELIEIIKSSNVERLNRLLSVGDEDVYVLYKLDLLRSMLTYAGMFAETTDEMRDAIFEAVLSKVNIIKFADGLLTLTLTGELMDKNLIPLTLRQALLENEWDEAVLDSIRNLPVSKIIALFWYMIEKEVKRVDSKATAALVRQAYELGVLDRRAMMLILCESLDVDIPVFDMIRFLAERAMPDSR